MPINIVTDFAFVWRYTYLKCFKTGNIVFYDMALCTENSDSIWVLMREKQTLLHANNKRTDQPVHPLSLIRPLLFAWFEPYLFRKTRRGFLAARFIWASTWENLSSEVCEQQRRRPACPYPQSDQRLCYSLLESIISKLATSEISNFLLVSVAEETGWSLAFSETPKTGFLAMRPICDATPERSPIAYTYN